MNMVNRIGRRGSYLIFLSLLDFLYGYSLVIQVGPLFLKTDLLLPSVTWGYIWITVGAICFLQAFSKLDRVAYVLAVCLKFIWATIALYNWVFLANDPKGWIAMVIWYAFAALTAIVSFWPEHIPVNIGDYKDDS